MEKSIGVFLLTKIKFLSSSNTRGAGQCFAHMMNTFVHTHGICCKSDGAMSMSTECKLGVALFLAILGLEIVLIATNQISILAVLSLWSTK